MTHKEHADARRLLILATGHMGSRGAGRENTGLWFPDLAESVYKLRDDDYAIDTASPNGGAIPLDSRSVAEDALSTEARSYYEDPGFMVRLELSIPFSNVNWRDYEAAYLPGGQGVLWDTATGPRVPGLVSDAFQDGRVVAMVGYGLAGVLDSRNADGSWLLSGRNVAGPSSQEKHESQTAHLPIYVGEKARERGAIFEASADPATDRVEVGGRLITGQSVLSARKVAQALCEQIKPHHHD